MNVIQWFVRLIRRDMKNFSEEKEEDRGLYRRVLSELREEKERGGEKE